MIEHRILLEHDWRHRDPAKYLPLRSLQELVVRQLERLCDALTGILEKTPNYLRDARGRLAELPGLVSILWLADALELSEKGLPWLKLLGRDLPQTREC
jgi:peptidoglycan/xylan/chitin deacetylase (PgdA/CDA1 family)